MDHFPGETAVLEGSQAAEGRRFVGREDGVDAGGDHGLDDLDLLVPVVLLERALPDDPDAQLVGGRQGAGMDGLPKFVGCAHRDDGQPELFGGGAGSGLAALAGGDGQDRHGRQQAC